VNWDHFFAMGGYAFYVWTSYVLAAVIFVFNVVAPIRRRRTVLRNLREFHRLKEKTQ
jgi:heme exporter protein D